MNINTVGDNEVTGTLRQSMGLVAAVDAVFTELGDKGLAHTHQPCVGAEATLAGAVAGIRDSDWVFWGRQVNAAALKRGLPLERLISHQLRSDAAAEIAALNIVAATSGPATRMPHAVGMAWAGRQDGVVALCELGDQAVSDGDFHCGVNFAGVMNAPVVFVVRSEGNIPVYARAAGYGVAGALVDGTDGTLVKAAVEEAADRARNGGGPTLIEARIARGQAVATLADMSFHDDAVQAALAVAARSVNPS
jgi:2-oxoisovalerate dehydrogenase E1 component alpha subunit